MHGVYVDASQQDPTQVPVGEPGVVNVQDVTLQSCELYPATAHETLQPRLPEHPEVIECTKLNKNDRITEKKIRKINRLSIDIKNYPFFLKKVK
ncbi:8600_t:CDS:2 [Cetraspora pellucida]|uniref:8600_t:CDS:1 n=1 Tax=Cetraspora pellucida TaxID=1433469 RepID=A0ACA9JWL0_9GLOM|nr:8600_t:CDS:2 [Cetraspora pellucida]